MKETVHRILITMITIMPAEEDVGPHTKPQFEGWGTFQTTCDEMGMLQQEGVGKKMKIGQKHSGEKVFEQLLPTESCS